MGKGKLLAWAALCLLPVAGLCEPAASAVRGEIVKTVYGAGTAQSASQPAVYAPSDANVSQVLVSVGDEVKAGDALMRLQNDALEAEIEQLEYDLAAAQEAVDEVETYSQYVHRVRLDDGGEPVMDLETGEPLLETYSNELSIYAPGDGRVAAVYIEPGDDALAVYRERGAVAVISTDGRMKVELDSLDGSLSLDERVLVTGEGVQTEGTVVDLTRRGTQAVVEIVGDAYAPDTPVTVFAEDGRAVGEGVLEVNKPLMVSAYGGTIKGVAVQVGDEVKRGKLIARFVWDEMPLYIDNASVLHDYAKAKTALEQAREKQNRLTVVAPCDGVIATLDALEGDDVTDGARLCSLVESGAGMTVVLEVDELDILAVKPGQTVVMTADAFPEESFTGTVLKIAPLGNVRSGVTTYDVTVTAQGLDERIRSGMNVSGEIAVASETDALLVPVDALQKDDAGYFVRLADGTARGVTLGLMTDSFAQILSGLQEGDALAY